ncbi:hypothetical protein D7B24_009215 [Verticillium nonalfalfae]|uniref:Protein kinase domain-containing protein n=1 Tax=Verticillium nonalfalfae TaxID=1051616 RepID=A0A3M9YIK7_9PEZI|nr:uncharacterized protein D7B24_009215 [Verticillium nonalfalfae]RNJ60184.1 hypothetical protein D7B24_009215 [Verticillium nonalfalfae]
MSSPCEDATTDEPSYENGSWSMGDDGFDLGVRMNGKRFRIAVWADYFKDSPSATAAFQKALAIMNDGDDSCEELWDYLEWIVDFFLPQFQSLAPPVVHAGILTLAHLAVRESFECEFHVIQEKPVPGLVTRLVEEDFEEFDARTLQTSFPIVGLADVEVPYDDPAGIFSIIPQRVLVHGQFFFYKSSVSTEATRNEIGKYDKIAASGPSSSELPTSRLYAIVVGSKGRLRGLIYHFIKSEERLTWAVDERAPLALREKWAAQIKDTVAKLHHLGVVWGDVKADNVSSTRTVMP